MDRTVLCYIEHDDCYLLLYRNKKKNDLNEGKYIGIGGHIEDGESVEQALLREIKEETNLTLLDYQYRGDVYFKDDNYEEIMYLFTTSSFKGDIKPCDEGELHWINKKDLLTLPHWEGDEYFLKLLQEGISNFELELEYKNGTLIRYKRNK